MRYDDTSKMRGTQMKEVEKEKEAEKKRGAMKEGGIREEK